MASASINLGLSREACEGAWRPPSLFTSHRLAGRWIGCLRPWSVLLCTAVVLVSAKASPLQLQTEPVYAGKPIGDWLNSGHEDACQAVHEVGTPAMPFILQKLASEDPAFGWNSRYARFHAWFPPAIRRLLPKPGPTNFDRTRACSLLLEVGPAGIPVLAEALHHKNPAVREVSARVLGMLSQKGKNIRIAISSLQTAKQDRWPEVRLSATRALDSHPQP